MKKKKNLEVKKRNNIIKEMIRRVKDDNSDNNEKDIEVMMFRKENLR